TALSQNYFDDRRGRGWFAYPHTAADILLPPHEGTDRARAYLYCAAASVSREARQERTLHPRRAGLRARIDEARNRRSRGQSQGRRESGWRETDNFSVERSGIRSRCRQAGPAFT